MKTSVSFCDFCDAFRDMGRNDNFSYEGKRALFDYLEQYEEETGADVELDVIALCCEYNEDSPENIANNYSIDLSDADDIEDEDEKAEMVAEIILDYLNDNTSVVGVLQNGDIVYAAF